MLYAPEAQALTERFHAEIEEFRTIARMHDLATGTPERLVDLPLRLSQDWRLRSNFIEMIRALQQRDPELSLPDALTVLTVAIGGPSALGRQPALDEPLDLTAGFLASLGGWPGSAVEPLIDIDNPPDHDPRLDLAAQSAADGDPNQAPGPASSGTELYTADGLPADLDLEPEAPSLAGSSPELYVSSEPVPLAQITEALARLERGNLELRLHLDSIDQRISRMEPLLESAPHADLDAAAADPGPTYDLPRATERHLHDPLPPAAPAFHAPPAPSPPQPPEPAPSPSRFNAQDRSPAGTSRPYPDPAPAESPAPVPQRDLVHRDARPPLVSPTPQPARTPNTRSSVLEPQTAPASPATAEPQGRRISLDPPRARPTPRPIPPRAIAEAPAAAPQTPQLHPAAPQPSVRQPASPQATAAATMPQSRASFTTLPGETADPVPHPRSIPPRRDRFAAARELPGSRAEFEDLLSAIVSPEPASPHPEAVIPFPQPVAEPLAAPAPAPEPVRATDPEPFTDRLRPSASTLFQSGEYAAPRAGASPLFETDSADATSRSRGPVLIGVAAAAIIGAAAVLLVHGPVSLPHLGSSGSAASSAAPDSGSAAKPSAGTEDGSDIGTSPTAAATPNSDASGTRAGLTPAPAGDLSASPTFVPEATMDGYLVSAPRPEYPKLANLVGLDGKVVFEAMISRDGKVEALKTLGGNRILRDAATDAVKQWQYRPFLVKGRPVEVRTIVRVEVSPPHHAEPAETDPLR